MVAELDQVGAVDAEIGEPVRARALLLDDLARIVPPDEPLDSTGSSFYAGWWSYVDKDLRTLLGRSVQGQYGTRFCGRGVVSTCAASLWAALDAAAAELAAAQGSDASAWRADATAERIRFAPGILTRTMRGSRLCASA